jgi:GDP-mannose 6-dehydrogenase
MLTVTTDAYATVLGTDISLICVGTPSTSGGGLSTRFLEQVTTEIGAALADKDQWHTVVYRSTMLPGTCETLLIPLLEKASGKRVGRDFGVCVNPEFLREGSSVRDFLNPSKTVVGETDPRSGDAVIGLYEGLPGPRFRVPVRVAEMTKYVDNSFHALKVCFGRDSPSAAHASPRTFALSSIPRAATTSMSPCWRMCSPPMRSICVARSTS